MARSSLRRAIDAFRLARREHRVDVHDAARAEALRLARVELDARVHDLLERLPFAVYLVTEHAHYATRQEVLLREGRRHRGQTLCGADSGRPAHGHPAPCTACLLVAERYLVEGPPDLELELGL